MGISYSGESKDTVDVMKTAKKAGATTIAITNFKDSPISRYADILICTSQEQFIYGNAIFSRIPQLQIVDMLYMGIIASDYDRYVKILDRGEKMVRERHTPPGRRKRSLRAGGGEESPRQGGKGGRISIEKYSRISTFIHTLSLCKVYSPFTKA